MNKKDDGWLERAKHENLMTQLIRSMKKYSILSYKEFLDIRVNNNRSKGIKLDDFYTKYELYTHPIIEKLYGKIYFIERNGFIVDVQPYDYLYRGYRTEYVLYKGVFIEDTPKERFKVDMYSSMFK